MSSLPHRDEDPVLTLHAHYFVAAELMLKNHLIIRAKRHEGRELSRDELVDSAVYLRTWLGFLAVVCEGFKRLKVRLVLHDRPAAFSKLIAKADAIGKLIKAHDDSLREMRNTTFHLRTHSDTKLIINFFSAEPSRVDWARNLQNDLTQFFSEYRVECELEYMQSGRDDERML